MKPLQPIATGLVIVALVVRVHGYDVLADPLGWLLVLAGVQRLPRDLAWAGTIRALARLSALVSVLLWFPGVVTALEDADESLLWAATLPQLGFVAALTVGLARAAGEHGDRSAAAWLRTAATLTGVAAVAPAVVYGSGRATLLVPTVVLATFVLVLVICLLLSYAARPWATGPATGEPGAGPEDEPGEEPGDATGAAPPGGGTAPAA